MKLERYIYRIPEDTAAGVKARIYSRLGFSKLSMRGRRSRKTVAEATHRGDRRVKKERDTARGIGKKYVSKSKMVYTRELAGTGEVGAVHERQIISK